MSWDASIKIEFGGEERRFRLAIGQLRELQETVNKDRAQPIGPWSLFQLMLKGDAWPDDLRAVIRLGLIGGGETRSELIPGLLKRYVDERPMLEIAAIAQAILGSALVEVRDDPVGKKLEPEAVTNPTLSGSRTSTETAQPLDSPRDKSTNAHFGNSRPVSRDTTEPTVPTNRME